jgi:two-component system response regulator GlrR
MSTTLLLNQRTLPCGERQCDLLRPLLARVPSFDGLVELPPSIDLAEIPLAPDIVFLRLTTDIGSRQLIESCRVRWRDALIVVILCCRTGVRSAEMQSALAPADDFLFCSALERELLLRSERLLLFRPPKIAFQNPQLKGLSKNLPLIGQSPPFLAVINKAVNLARTDATVLISGETGSGKELIARAIHYQGARRSKPFIPVNCGALPDHLFENELFGHNKGAFTDATSAEQGLVAEAEGGTLFLDEVDALSPSAQIKLLRFLQNGEYRPLGSSRSVFADVRVIAATNSDLNEKVRLKHFRVDLFYRLNILSIEVPALRERGTDVLCLAEHFLDLYGNRDGVERLRLSEAARQKLCNYSWPGNVRELQAVIQRAALLSSAGILHAADVDLPEGKSKDILRHESLRRAKSFIVGEFERSYVANLLARHQGNITQAAKAAGKDRRTLQRLVRKYSLDRASFKL